MSFHALIAKVEQAEQALEQRERRAAARWRRAAMTWRASWTPGRIVVIGAALGFVIGRARPLRLAGSGGLLNLASALSGLFAAERAQDAAENADAAATEATAQDGP